MTFSPDYSTARVRFCAAATALGWSCETYPTGDFGPRGETLSVDVASSAYPGSSDGVLIVSSGLHGVEGPFGSAVQLALLERWKGEHALPANVRCVFVHALNPYGFAWSRRCDVHNVDLNRAFRWADAADTRADDGYARLDGLLNPRTPPSAFDAFAVRMLWAVAKAGPASIRRAVATGQHDFPKGLFFAGQTTSWVQHLLQRHLRSWIGPARTVVHLDLHTGLGAWARPALIVDYPLPPRAKDLIARAFGAGVLVESAREPASYTAQGSLGQWCVSQECAREYYFAFAEFGTYGNLRVLSGLRAENRAHHWAPAEDPRAVVAQARLRELFCPQSPDWRWRVTESAISLIERAAWAAAAIETK